MIETEMYLIAVIIVMLIGVIMGLKRILSLEEKMTYLIDSIKNEEDEINRKVSPSRNFRATRDKMMQKKKLLGKIKKR